MDEVVPPLGDGQNYFSFFVPTLLTETETTDFLARGIELSIAIDITYIGTSGKRSRQGFGDFYVCRVGNLEINKPIGKGPQSQEIEKYEGESTLVASKVRILEEAQESLPKPSAQKHPKLRKK